MMSSNKLTRSLHGLKITSLNVNSLNLSANQNTTNVTRFDLKIAFLLEGGPDVVLLQDTRLGDLRNETVIQKKVLNHQAGQYLTFFNSSSNARGVGILIKRQLNFKIVKEYKTRCENAIILDIIINDSRLSIGSLYGPRQRDNPNFFNEIFELIEKIGNENYLLAGDLNTVTCCTKPTVNQNLNIDLHNVAKIPNPAHMNIINKKISMQSCADIFRSFYPDKKVFSYMPFNIDPLHSRKYKSRIDHALSNMGLCEKVSSLNYDITPSIFDHKIIRIQFGEFKPSPPSLDNSFLNVDSIYEIGVSNAYDTISDYTSFKLCNETLTVLRILKNEILGMAVFLKSEPNDLLIKKLIKIKFLDFKNAAAKLPSMEEIMQNELNINPVLFFQTLINNMTNSIISAQLTLKASESAFAKSLEKKFENESNELLKSKVEIELKKLEQQKIELFCKKHKLWRILNNEKPSKAFCLMTKNAKNVENIDCLLNHNVKINNCATNFNNAEHRKIETLNHYRKIYENPPQKNLDINSFLGDNLNNSDKIKKLSELDKKFLDSKLTMNDIKDAIKTVNSDSAAGHDGITYKFYKIFLNVTGAPLLNCFNFMVEKGELLPPFNKVKMLIIPKKGDLTNIKNWRSLSLCYSSYKIFSTAISRRLAKVMDKLTAVEQKAYSQKKNISETMLNIFNRISRSNKKNERLATLALDFSKAFDRLHHGYISEVLNWLNFPASFINMIKTILTNRVAYIKNFDDVTLLLSILVGVPQGDSISGSLFILCLQPLLVKFGEKKSLLNPTVSKIEKFYGPPSAEKALSTNFIEDGEADFSFFTCYADDLTILFNITEDNLLFIINTMNSFESLSGLTTNFEKTGILFSGGKPDESILRIIHNAGIKIEENLTILGFRFNSDLSNLNENIDEAIVKLKSLICFWSKMFLSTVGKVSVSNTYLMSQLSYLMSVVTPSPQQCKIVDNLVKDFICGKNKISFDTIFLPKILGGLGMCQTEITARALKLNLFVRSLNSDDVWATAIQNCCLNKKHLIYEKCNNILDHYSFSNEILTSFFQFEKSFYCLNKNILSTPIRNLNILQDGTSTASDFSNAIAVTLSSPTAGTLEPDLKLLSLFKSSDNLVVKTLDEMKEILNPSLTHENYNVIKRFLKSIIVKYKIGRNQKIVSIKNVIFSKMKGSKKFKIFFFDNEKLQSKGLKKRKKLLKIEIDPSDLRREKGLIFVQNFNFIENSLREFILKLRSNLLFSNSQIAHFVQEKNAACVQCALVYPLSPPPKESYAHMLFECPVLETLKFEITEENQTLKFLLNNENAVMGSMNQNPVKRTAENIFMSAFNFIYYKNRNANRIITAKFLVKSIFNLINVETDKIELLTAINMLKASDLYLNDGEENR